NTHETMHAPFSLAEAVSIFTADQQCRAFNSCSFAWCRTGNFDFPAAAFAPTLIHAQKHVGPIASFGAAGAGVDVEDAIAFVVRAGEQRTKFKRFEFAFEFC